MKWILTFVVALLGTQQLGGAPFVREVFAKPARYSFADVKFHVSYVPGGVPRSELPSKYPAKSGFLSAIPGGYFSLESNPLRNVDYTLRGSRVLVPYLSERQRPVILFSKRGARIAWPEKDTGGFSRSADETDGLAGDNHCQKPERPLLRTIVGVTKSTLTVYMVRGTEDQCHRLMSAEKYQRKQYLFMDGGDSVLPTTPMPSHIVVFKRTSRAIQ